MDTLRTGHSADMAATENDGDKATFLRAIAARLVQAADTLDAGEPVADVFARWTGRAPYTAEEAAQEMIEEARRNLRTIGW